MMMLSQSGLDFIKRWEGLRLEAYIDIAAVPTIGYGHTRTVTAADVAGKKTITRKEATALLREDLADHERRVRKLIKVAFTQNEFDALVSFDFNTGGLHRSTALKRLNAGDRIGAADALLWWNKATIDGRKVEVLGLARRREAEREMFLATGRKAASVQGGN